MAKPKLALLPAAQGTSLYSVLPSSGVGDFDFTRSGSATRINSQGLIETVASGVSRLNYPLIDGVVKGCPHHILEPQRFNGITNNKNFDGTNMINSAIITEFNTTETLSPEGINNASKLTANSDFQRYSLYPTIGDNVDVSVSVFAKKGSASVFKMLIIDKSGQAINETFDLLNETTLDGIGKIENFGNGWFRCSITASTSSGATTFQIRPFTHGAGYDNGWTGSNYIYGFGAQYEVGSYPSSVIFTSGAAVTRSAETANGSGDAATFNDSEGVLMAEISALDDDLTPRYISLSNGTVNERLIFGFFDTSNQVRVIRGANFIVMEVSLDVKNNNKIALVYEGNNVNLWANGYKLGTSSSYTPINGINSLNFDSGAGSSNFYGNTKQLQYFDTALTDSELEQLTSWVSFTDMAESQLYSVE